ncbi:MAG: hypothetical protein JNK92_05855 [Dechloromonas sp.]|nr:hypothetical protein [Dechloromonas sp.]
MTDHDLRALPARIRDAFNGLADEQFFGDPNVAKALRQRDEADAEYTEALGRSAEVRIALSNLDDAAVELIAEVEQLTAARTGLLADLFLSGTGHDEIEELRTRVAAINQRVSDFKLARPAIVGRINELQRHVGAASSRQSSISETLCHLLDGLKLAEAKRLA